MKYTIKDLTEGRVTLVYTSGNLNKLRKVLKRAFPNDVVIPEGFNSHYGLKKGSKEEWTSSDFDKLNPMQDLEDFDLWTPRYGEKVEAYNKKQDTWCLVLYVGTAPTHTPNKEIIAVQSCEDGLLYTTSEIRKVQIVELTLEDIANKFKIDVSQLKIIE